IDATETLLADTADWYEPAIGTLDAASAEKEGVSGAPDPGGPAGVGDPGRATRALVALTKELALARACLRAGRLRELVEARLTARPPLAELLRYLDAGAGALLDERAPVLGGPTRTYVTAEALRRPEVARFRA